MILVGGIQQLAVGDLRADEIAGLTWWATRRTCAASPPPEQGRSGPGGLPGRAGAGGEPVATICGNRGTVGCYPSRPI